ncbi:MAG: site-2 protease family protein [bacterium]
MHVDPRDLKGDGPPPAQGDRTILLVFGLLVAGLFGAEVLRDFTPAKSAVFFFLIAWFPLTALHEAGHAWVARLFGWRVFEVVIGFGRVVKRWQWGSTRVELRTFPLGGYVVPVPRERTGARLASFFIYAAGPGIEILLVVLIGGVIGFDTLTSPSTSVGIVALQAISAAALTGAITNLLPMTTPEGAGRTAAAC